MYRKSASAVFSAVRMLFRSWTTLPLVMAVFAALLLAVYLFVSTREATVAQLVLTIVEFLRRLMERQAIRRMEQKTLTRKEIDDVGRALMQLEETVRDIGARFGLTPQGLNLVLGPLGKLM